MTSHISAQLYLLSGTCLDERYSCFVWVGTRQLLIFICNGFHHGISTMHRIHYGWNPSWNIHHGIPWMELWMESIIDSISFIVEFIAACSIALELCMLCIHTTWSDSVRCIYIIAWLTFDPTDWLFMYTQPSPAIIVEYASIYTMSQSVYVTFNLQSSSKR